jgi:hypothetical protein
MFNRRFNKYFFYLTLFVFFLLVFPPSVSANYTYTDDFDDGYLGSEWVVNNYRHGNDGSYSSFITPFIINENNGVLNITGSGNYNDWVGKSVILENQIVSNGKIYVETSVSINNSDDRYQAHITIEVNKDNRIVFSMGKGSYYLAQLIYEEYGQVRCEGGAINPGGCAAIPFPQSINTDYILKILYDTETNLVTGFINGDQIIQGTYMGDVSNFKVGIAISSIPNYNSFVDASFDYFKATQVDENLNMLDVPDLKQIAPESWSGDQYDHLSGVTISDSGCALTSSTMILRYYNHDVFPDELNSWLNNHNGYNRAGGIVWGAVSNYALTHNTPIDNLKPVRHIEWNRIFSHDNSVIDSQVDNEQPVIANVPGHFVVVKGKTNSDYYINDPASHTHTLLSETEASHGGDYFKLETYTPTSTDLSYIYLLVDDDIHLKVIDPNGNEVIGGYDIETPITNENTNEPIGETLNSFALPKPEPGLYRVEISGAGEYQLDSYLYDEEGNVDFSENAGDLGNSESVQSYYIYVNDEGVPMLINNDLNGLVEFIGNYDKNKIKKRGVYNHIINYLVNINKHMSKDQEDVVQILLGNLTAFIEGTKDFLINPEYANSLLEVISSLRNT